MGYCSLRDCPFVRHGAQLDPHQYTTIFGLQGRYWLPVLPLVLALVHHNRTFAVQKPAERKAVFAMLCLTSFVILQGAGLYATFQMPS